MEAGLQRVGIVHESAWGLFLCKHSARVRFTFVSAQCVSPSSCITLSTFSFLSLEDKDEGRRRDAENRKFSRTVRVPMTTSSCNTNTTQYHPGRSIQHNIILQYLHNTVSSCNIYTTQHHSTISTLFCIINTTWHHPAITTQQCIILHYQNNILSKNFKFALCHPVSRIDGIHFFQNVHNNGLHT